jgi:hypothetical protein
MQNVGIDRAYRRAACARQVTGHDHRRGRGAGRRGRPDQARAGSRPGRPRVRGDDERRGMGPRPAGKSRSRTRARCAPSPSAHRPHQARRRAQPRHRRVGRWVGRLTQPRSATAGGASGPRGARAVPPTRRRTNAQLPTARPGPILRCVASQSRSKIAPCRHRSCPPDTRKRDGCSAGRSAAIRGRTTQSPRPCEAFCPRTVIDVAPRLLRGSQRPRPGSRAREESFRDDPLCGPERSEREGRG